MTIVQREPRLRGKGHVVLLLHPDGLDAHRCRITVARRGLLLCRLTEQPSRPARVGSTLHVPWWTVRGFAADDSEHAPDGSVLQRLEVVTDAGTLLLLASAPEVSVLLAEVGRRSGRWRRARRPLAAGAARRAATVAQALSRRPAWASRTGGLHRRGAGSAGRPVSTPFAAPGIGPRARPAPGLRAVLAVAGTLAVAGGVLVGVSGGGSASSGANPTTTTTAHRHPSPKALRARDVGASTTVGLLPDPQDRRPLDLPPATAPPAPAPPSLADDPPLQPHEVFGFAPYWTLTQSTGFDLGGLTTIAYFSIGVNPDGSLDESGPGWQGYESQALADLVTRAHDAGVRVVLTVNCFDQGSLNQLTSSATAPATLASAVVAAIEAKNLDGVNLDLEGEGSADQAGLTNLVTQVSDAVHAANPHDQVTMDTYASSAGDPGGFYDIPALAPVVDAFFVMAYQLNLQAGPNAASPLTSSMFSDLTTVEQYASAVPPSKVIMGLPFYGEQWPTTDGTMNAQATGTAAPVSYAQIMAGGHPVYWDDVTDTAWTSYQVGGQWFEEYFEDPTSLYLVAQLSQFFGLGGVGAWALGMDGDNPQMVGALDGLAPAQKDTTAGQPATTTTTAPTGSATSATPATGSTSTSTTLSGGTGSSALRYSGTWDGQTVSLTLQSWKTFADLGTPKYLGQLSGFQTNDPAYACLAEEPGLSVWSFGPSPSVYTVVAEQPTNCVTAEFTFPVPSSATSSNGTTASLGTAGPTTTTTTTTTVPPTTTTTTSTTIPATSATTVPSTATDEGTAGTTSTTTTTAPATTTTTTVPASAVPSTTAVTGPTATAATPVGGGG